MIMVFLFCKQIDECYNPLVLAERVKTFYNIVRERMLICSDNVCKLERIVEIIKDNPDKRFLIISKRGEYAATVVMLFKLVFSNKVFAAFSSFRRSAASAFFLITSLRFCSSSSRYNFSSMLLIIVYYHFFKEGFLQHVFKSCINYIINCSIDILCFTPSFKNYIEFFNIRMCKSQSGIIFIKKFKSHVRDVTIF